MHINISQTLLPKPANNLLFTVAILVQTSAYAQNSTNLEEELQDWIDQSATVINLNDLDSPVVGFNEIVRMVGDAKIVAISESNHGIKESMLFRNQLFKLLVEHADFEAIALESGVIESKVLNDYVTNGVGELETLFERGITNGFDKLRQNQELVSWIRDYNQQLPANSRKLQIFGFDVSGSPYQSTAARNPDTAIRIAMEYLQTIDPSAAAEFTGRLERFLPVLAGVFEYGKLSAEERNELTSSINDLIVVFQRSKFQYIALSSESDYEWAAQSAIAARQIDSWFREIPIDWEPSDGFSWNERSQEIRDYIMSENLDWIVDQLSPDGRLVVFASVGHIASAQKYLAEDANMTRTMPFGMYARTNYGSNFVNILNLTVGGELEICNMPRDERVTMTLNPPPEDSMEAMFTNRSYSNYLLDLRSAPALVAEWLEQEQQHWNGFGTLVLPIVPAFDIVYYVSAGTPDCLN